MKLFRDFNWVVFFTILFIIGVLLMIAFLFSLNVDPPKIISLFWEVISYPSRLLGLDSVLGFVLSKFVNMLFYSFLIERIITLTRK